MLLTVHTVVLGARLCWSQFINTSLDPKGKRVYTSPNALKMCLIAFYYVIIGIAYYMRDTTNTTYTNEDPFQFIDKQILQRKNGH